MAAGTSFRMQRWEEGACSLLWLGRCWTWGLAPAQRIGFHWEPLQMPSPVYVVELERESVLVGSLVKEDGEGWGREGAGPERDV